MTTVTSMNNTAALIILALVALLVLAVVVGRVVTVAGWRVSPAAMTHYEHALADMQQRLERTELRGDRQQERIDQLQAALEVEQEYSRALARAMRDAGLEPPPRPTPLPPPVPAWADTSSRLAACFSVSELNDLAMELALLEAVAGESLEERASSLTLAAVRRGVLSELRTIARRERPRGGF